MSAEFPGNSKMPRPQSSTDKEKKIDPVVTNEVQDKKKSLTKRFTSIFIGGDSRSVVNYVFMDVLVPQLKEMLAEATSQGIERMIYGESRPPRRGGSNIRPGGPTNYSRYSVRGNNPLGRAGVDDRRPVDTTRTQDVADLLFATRPEAELTLERMFDLLEKYGVVTIADMNSLIDRTSNYTDQKWGWTNLHGSNIMRDRQSGYILELPRVTPID